MLGRSTAKAEGPSDIRFARDRESSAATLLGAVFDHNLCSPAARESLGMGGASRSIDTAPAPPNSETSKSSSDHMILAAGKVDPHCAPEPQSTAEPSEAPGMLEPLERDPL